MPARDGRLLPRERHRLEIPAPGCYIVTNQYQFESATEIDHPMDWEPCTESELDALVPFFQGLSLNNNVTSPPNNPAAPRSILRKPSFLTNHHQFQSATEIDNPMDWEPFTELELDALVLPC